MTLLAIEDLDFLVLGPDQDIFFNAGACLVSSEFLSSVNLVSL
jgi:hypothetical protein